MLSVNVSGRYIYLHSASWLHGYYWSILSHRAAAMRLAQDAKCAICSDPEKVIGNGVRGLHFDHDHKTGKARGLLCARCNQVLGRVKENKDLLVSMIAYLSKESS